MSDLYYCYVFKLCTQPSGVEVTNNQLVNLSVNWKLFVSKESIKYFKSLAYFLCVSQRTCCNSFQTMNIISCRYPVFLWFLKNWKNNGTEKISFVTSILAPKWHEHFKERKTSLSLPRRVFTGLIAVIDLLKYILCRFQGWGLSNVCFLWTYICARTRLRCSYLSADIEPPLVDYP